ncbi:hypothetical protein H0H92_005996, partial [Tricholoma furcatifolium]
MGAFVSTWIPGADRSKAPTPSSSSAELRGGWMPQDPAVMSRWLSEKVDYVNEKDEPFIEVVQRFREFIENDATILTLFQQMFTQVPTMAPYDKDTWQQPS